MNFVFSGQQETQEVLTTLQQLSKKVENSKIQLYDAITNKYVDFSPTFKTTEEMVESFENLSKEIHSISDKIQNEVYVPALYIYIYHKTLLEGAI